MKAILVFLYSFLMDGFPLLLMFAPFYLFLRALFLLECTRDDAFYKVNPIRESVMFAFFVFLVLLFAQTFVFNEGLNQIILIPFSTITKQIRQMGHSLLLYRAFIFNTIGNIAIFAPIGIFSAYLFKTDFKHTTLLGFLISLTIEGGQLPLDRTSDVDDLILNTIGAIAGYGIYKLFKKLKNRWDIYA